MASITSSIDDKQPAPAVAIGTVPSSSPTQSYSVSSSNSVSTLQRDLKDARSEIDRLKLLLVKQHIVGVNLF